MSGLYQFCESCGDRLTPDARFCPSCGRQSSREDNAPSTGGGPPAPGPYVPPPAPPQYAPPPPPPPPPPQVTYGIPQVARPYEPVPAAVAARTPASPGRSLAGGLPFLLGVLILLGSEVVRLVTRHADPLDLLGYVIILAFALPASLLAIRSKRTGKCAAALVLACLAMVFVLTDLWGLITNSIFVMQNPLGDLSPEYQRSFMLSKVSYALGHLVAILAFVTMWISLPRKRRTE
jgi:hypothetical protein